MTTPIASAEKKETVRSPAQWVTLSYAAVFLLVGAAGFIPGITTGYDTLQFAGHHSEAMLFGIFQVSALHNIVHVLYGLVGVALARSATSARHFLLWGGVVYLGLWLYGLIIDTDSVANFVPLNTADDWLHLGLGVTMIALSFLRRESRHARSIR
ncbi:DUF4383 domain-containing protein [Nesterenkonia halotolerans]|uniref:DUF4383 domain-containing protein n=1 Tax=Nesterenkonia halotolerans TaxID=225325 RepID=A0ABR9J5Z9_9MICC|nr:DUF4383 domain-containing protein [Nesterenkonia halotolerans]MBE1514426.1 hypothetical protein [Nesterenkonia halotolerans]